MYGQNGKRFIEFIISDIAIPSLPKLNFNSGFWVVFNFSFLSNDYLKVFDVCLIHWLNILVLKLFLLLCSIVFNVMIESLWVGSGHFYLFTWCHTI